MILSVPKVLHTFLNYVLKREKQIEFDICDFAFNECKETEVNEKPSNLQCVLATEKRRNNVIL